MTDTLPFVPTDAPAFHDLADIAWTPVQQQRNADGSVSVVREKWPIIRPGFLSAYVHYESGMVVRRHGHRSNHIVIVLGGGAWIGGAWSGPDTHFHVPLGAAFGPIVAGPEGVTCWELSFGEFGGWGDQPELYEREIAARGVTPLPDPPLVIGDWFKDPRGDWGAARATPKVDGLDERVTHLAELPWTDLAAGVRTKRPIDEPAFESALVEHAPGASRPRAVRQAQHLVLVVDGGVHVADRWCPAGTHVEVPAGVAFGPVTAGDDGARLFEMTDGDHRVAEVS